MKFLQFVLVASIVLFFFVCLASLLFGIRGLPINDIMDVIDVVNTAVGL